MRIPGIHRFVSDTLQPRSLKNCEVVIDGHAYFYKYYQEARINDIFGCEGDGFAAYLGKKLYIFKKTNIVPYFIFKGGDNDINVKINKFKATAINLDAHNISFCNVLPVFATEIVKIVLDNLNIDYGVSVGEPKDECVALARRLGCPVISDGAAYYFKQAPFISHTSIIYNRESNSLDCKQYKLDDFIAKHSLTIEKVAVFVVFSDLSGIESEENEQIIKDLLNIWGILVTDLDSKHIKLVRWLASHEISDILLNISKVLSDDNNSKFLTMYNKNVASITNTGSTPIVSDYLFFKHTHIRPKDTQWFEKGVASKKISVPYINLYKWQILHGSMAVENKSGNDSLLLSIDIIVYAYNLLTNYRGDTIKVYQDSKTFVLIEPNETSVGRPEFSCQESVFENGWQPITNLRLFEHFLTENAIKINSVRSSDMDAVLIISLVYFSRKKNQVDVDVTDEVYCIVISYVMLHIVHNKTGAYVKRYNNCDESDCEEAKNITAEYFKLDNDEAKDIFDEDKLKVLVEFQYCLLHMNFLNILCGSTYYETQYHKFYNGTFIYKLLLDMSKTNRDTFIINLFEDTPSILNYIKGLINRYHDLL